jgi:tellurite methyltransferase
VTNKIRAQFGDIDIYLFDQIQRGRIDAGARIFDGGFGGGRNLVFFLREGYEVSGVDTDAAAVQAMRALAQDLAPGPHDDRFRHEPLEDHSFPDKSADVSMASAVLHFARDDGQFEAMLQGAWRVLVSGGLLFSRLASMIGIEDRIIPRGGNRFRLPDGSERYLVSEARLMELTERLQGGLADPLKTTLVQNQRAMTTWVVRRR